MSKLSVLQISPFFSPNTGGVETHLDDLIKLAGKRKIKNTVIAYQPLVGSQRDKGFERRGNSKIYRVNWLRNIFYKTEKYPILHFIYLTPYLALRSLIIMKKESKKIDIVHSHGINAAVIGVLIKKLFKKPLVVSLHVELNLLRTTFSTRFILFCLKKADCILVLTKKTKKKLIKLGIDERKIKLFSYWVDQQIFSPQNKQQIRKQLKWDMHFNVLFVGRLVIEKGVKVLLDVAKKMPDIQFIFAGTGQLDNEVRQRSREYNNIIYLGKISNTKLTTYYNAADVLVVPSLIENVKKEYEEGVPRVIIEALSCGLPIIGTDNGGMKEIISESMVGKVCEGSLEAIIFAIREISNSNQMYQYKNRARQYALERFNERNGLIIIDTYEELRFQALIESKLKVLLEKVGDMALKRRAHSVIESLDLQKGKKILDVGCGDGFYLYLLSNLGVKLKLVGIDLEVRGLRSAKRNLRKKSITFIQADLMKRLPFASSSFDNIIMSEVAEHLLDDVKGLKEVYRILKQGGKLLLTVPCQSYPLLWDPVNWILEHLFKTHIKSGFWAGIWNQHVRLYSLRGINTVLESSGFSIEKSEIQTFWCIPFNHHILNLGARLLTSKRLPSSLENSVNKFSESPNKNINPISLFFAIINLIDKLNNVLSINSSGVSIFVKARK